MEWSRHESDEFERQWMKRHGSSGASSATKWQRCHSSGPVEECEEEPSSSSSQSQSQETVFLPGECWDWMQFGPAPRERDNCNVQLSNKLHELYTLYNTFPKDFPLGTSNVTNDIRALNARHLWNTVRALPRRVRVASQLSLLPGFGATWIEKINEILQTGTMRLLEERREQVRVMRLFQTVLYVGKRYSLRFYDAGCRTLEDLRQRATELHLSDNQLLGLKHHTDLNEKIPREEVEDMRDIVGKTLHQMDAAFELSISGSYRRGEDPCSDIDFVVTHPSRGVEAARRVYCAIDELVGRLQQRGIVTHVLQRETPTFGKAQSKSDEWWKSREDKDEFRFRLMLCVGRLSAQHPFRRIDFFACSKRSFAPFSLYTTGNVWFNRKLRQFAESKGFFLCNNSFGKIENGAVVPQDQCESEEDIFKLLGLKYVEPHERNY